MAIFKDKTGRGEVDYKSSVQSDDGTVLFLNDRWPGKNSRPFRNNFPHTTGSIGHLVFQLRGEGDGVEDVSNNSWSITEVSGTLTKRMEYVTHKQKLRTFEFSENRVLTLTASVSNSQFGAASLPVAERLVNSTILPYGIGLTGSEIAVISGWIYIDTYVGGNDGGGSCIMESVEEATGKRGFGLIVSSTGELSFRYYDWSHTTPYDATKFQEVKTQKKLIEKTWYHICVIPRGYPGSTVTARNYNSNGLDEKHQSATSGVSGPQVSIFINGKQQTNVTEDNPASGAIAAGVNFSLSNFPIVIGSGLGGKDNSPTQLQTSAYFKGRIAELSWFFVTGVDINASTAGYTDWRKTIATALYTGKKQPTSGISSLPPRVLIGDLDSQSSQPSISRSDASGRLGNHKLTFDDSKVQSLSSTSTLHPTESQIHYPTKLAAGDELLRTAFSGYHDGGLQFSAIGAGTTEKNSSDTSSAKTLYKREDNPVLDPFVESNYFIPNADNFYLTGTSESVMPYFDKKLRNKDMIQIKLNNTQDCQLGVERSADTSQYNVNNNRVDYMAYFNSTGVFDKKAGQTFHQASSPPHLATARGNLTGSCIGFVMPQVTLTMSSDDWKPTGTNSVARGAILRFPNAYYSSFGKPTNSYGFPEDNRYDPPNSTNLISMDSYITEPFLVEKIVYEFPEIGVYLDSVGPGGSTTTGAGCRGFKGYARSHDTSATDFLVSQTHGLEVLNAFLLRQSPGNSTGLIEHKIKNASSNPAAATIISGTLLDASTNKRELIDYTQKIWTGGIIANNPDRFIGEIDTYGKNIYAPDSLLPYKTSYPIADTVISSSIGAIVPLLKQITSLDIEYLSGSPSTLNTEISYKNLKLKSSVKVATKSEFRGTMLMLHPDATSANAAHVLQWTGNSSNSTDPVSSRHIVKGVAGQASPRSITITPFGGTTQSAFVTRITSEPSAIKAGSERDDLQSGLLDVETGDHAPYLLLPSDKLIFGVQSDPCSESYAKPTNTGIIIKPGEIKITMFGSYLKADKPKPSRINQVLSNNSVTEAFGDVDVHDQFEIEQRSTYRGSTSELAMSGSTRLSNPITAANTVLFEIYHGFDSITGQEANFSRRVGGRASDRNLGTTGSLNRSISASNNSIIEYDSFLFDIESIFKHDERTPDIIIANHGEGFASFVNDFRNPLVFPNAINSDFALITGDQSLFNFNTQPATRGLESTGSVPNFEFANSYKFSRYSHIAPRVRAKEIGDQSTEFFLYVTGSQESVPSLVEMASGSSATSTRLWIIGSADSKRQQTSSGPKSNYSMTTDSFARFFFGFGDGVQGAHRLEAPGYVGPGAVNLIYSGSVRGFRYGFSNIKDKNPKNIFRRNSYGQFRDMLENAPNTAYFNTNTNVITYPVEASFVRNDGSAIQGIETNSSNLSQHCTSSAPFFDRDTRSDTDPKNGHLVIRNRGQLQNQFVFIT
tara:strand:+ start:41495 stop:45856 length:4362 start_codon:yes stop_codon:yes gene_type:complete